MDRTADRIERFLADHPDGDLLVCVGFASAWGVAWLARRCRGRRVRLLIGDTRQRFGWEQVARADRNDCLEFLRSDSVEVRTWYRTDKSAHGPASAHLKAWMVHRGPRPLAALNGSANLSRNGLEANVEAMTEARGRDLTELWEKANQLWDGAWERGSTLIGYIEAPPRRHPRPPAGRPRRAVTDQRIHRSPAPPSRHFPNGRALFGAAAAIGLLLIVGVGLSFLDDNDNFLAPPPAAPAAPVSTVEPAEPATQTTLVAAEDSRTAEAATESEASRTETDARNAAVEAALEHADAAAAAAARATQIGERVQPLPDGIVSVRERKGWALGRVMVAEDCAAKAAANAGAASSKSDASAARDIAEQTSGHRECAEQAADAAQEWAEKAELWLTAECMNDLFTQSSHLESDWRPGWEFGCEAHVPDGVPCAYLNPTSPKYLEPGYLGAAGECRANTAILSRPEEWYECLPDDGSRWRGDWTADPINGHDLCP